MTDINVLIIVGLRAASVNRELAEVAADSSADRIALKMFDSLTDLPPRYASGTPGRDSGHRVRGADLHASVRRPQVGLQAQVGPTPG